MKKSKRFLAMCLTICLLLSMGSVAFAAENAAQPKISVDQGIQDTAAYVLRTVKNPVVGSIGGEWAILGLARSGYNVPQSYFDNYVATVEKTVKEAKGELHKVKYTEYSRVILAFTSLGRDVTNIGGYNFLEKLADFNNVKKQGINGPIFALIALDSNQYEIPQVQGVSVQTTRDMLIDFILGREITDAKGTLGGFALSGNIPDPDITGMALQALAPYQTTVSYTHLDVYKRQGKEFPWLWKMLDLGK